MTVRIRDLHKAYGSLHAVDGLDLDAAAGAVTAVLGPNGAGKTTTVEVCEGLRDADAGEVAVLGLRPGDADLRHRVGVMPQQAGGYPGARCAEMLRLVASYFRSPLDPDALLARLGLTDVARTPFRRLSGGQRQRLSMAMAVIGRPEVVFLDEPTAGLDVQARAETWQLVRDLRGDGVCVVLTTHDMDEATALADHVVVVDHGRVRAAGSVAELTAGSGSLRFAARPGLDLARFGVAGLHPSEPEPGRYVVTGEVTPDAVAQVAAWVAAQGAIPDGLRVGRDLEDVFLELTGRGLRA